MESKLEPVKTRIPYQLTLTLNEEEIRGLRHVLGAIDNSIKELIQQCYPSLSKKDVDFANETQFNLFVLLADKVDFLDIEDRAIKNKKRS